MKLRDMKQLLEKAADRRAKAACIVALMICHSEELDRLPPELICNALGLNESYKHTVRMCLQVRDEMRSMGFKVTNS